MTITCATRELYGGAIVVEIPVAWIDASILRQVPDHQEVFLSPSTFSNLIFEINEYLHPEHRTDSSVLSLSTSADDVAAVHLHLTDPIDPPDTVSPPDPPVVMIPTKLGGALEKLGAVAYQTSSFIHTTDVRSGKRGRTKIWLLVVRIRQYDTDLCVRLGIPLQGEGQQPGENGDDARAHEAEVEFRNAEEVIRRVAETLEVRDMGLFGAGE